MAERLPVLVEDMCQNEQHQYSSDEKVFRMNTTGSYRVTSVILDKHYHLNYTNCEISSTFFTWSEINYSCTPKH